MIVNSFPASLLIRNEITMKNNEINVKKRAIEKYKQLFSLLL